MRWWWFGPSATNSELQRELEQMKSAGIGGVEVATLYALALDDPATQFHNYDFVSDEHLDHLRFAAEQARRLGLRMDVTLGSGWPFGGPHIPVTQAAGDLRVEPVPVESGATSVAVPALEAGEKLMAAFLAPAQSANAGLERSPPAASARRPAARNSGWLRRRTPRAVFHLQPHRHDGEAAFGGSGRVCARSLRRRRDHESSARRGRSADVCIRRSSALCGLQRQPGGLRFGLDAGPPRGIPAPPRLRSHAAASGPGGRHRARHGRRPARLGTHADRTRRRTVPAADP